MNYLEAFNTGFAEGRSLSLKLINDHCEMEFKTFTEVINYIREVESSKQLETQNV